MGETHDIIPMQGGAQLRKEDTPMSVEEAIALLMLVLAAISLGADLKK